MELDSTEAPRAELAGRRVDPDRRVGRPLRGPRTSPRAGVTAMIEEKGAGAGPVDRPVSRYQTLRRAEKALQETRQPDRLEKIASWRPIDEQVAQRKCPRRARSTSMRPRCAISRGAPRAILRDRPRQLRKADGESEPADGFRIERGSSSSTSPWMSEGFFWSRRSEGREDHPRSALAERFRAAGRIR